MVHDATAATERLTAETAAAVTALERDWPDWLVWTVSPYMGSPEWCARRGDDRKNVLNADPAEHLAEALEDEASR